MKGILFCVAVLSYSTAALSSSSISQLDVLGDTATFTLSEPKTHTIPSCVSAEHQQKWAINLNSLQGQAMYSLLVTAVSKDQLISVKSAERCESLSNVEQAASVSLSINPVANNQNSGTMLYKGDGVTKLGKITGYDSKAGGHVYIPVEDNTATSYYFTSFVDDFFGEVFLDEQCQGTPYSRYHYTKEHSLVFYRNLNAYMGFAPQNEANRSIASYGDALIYQYHPSSGCRKRGSAKHDPKFIKLVKKVHPVCGELPCVIK